MDISEILSKATQIFICDSCEKECYFIITDNDPDIPKKCPMYNREPSWKIYADKCCVSCGDIVPVEEHFKYAPVILCKSCAKTLDKNSFTQHPDEVRRAALNLGRP